MALAVTLTNLKASSVVLRRPIFRISHTRCCMHSSGSSNDPSKEPKSDHLRPPGGVKTYIVKKYVGYISGFEFKVAEHYPKFYKVYKLFKNGISEFFNDTKLYSVVATRIWAGEGLDQFSWRELEIYRQMPSDLLRSAPVLLAAPLPAVPWFFYPICYMFPRHLLCRHFWTAEQKAEFGLHELRQRLPFYLRVLHSLERHSVDIRDTGDRHRFQDTLRKIERGEQLSVEEILSHRHLFQNRPFSIKRAPKLQMWYVARSLDFSTLRKSRFMNDAILLHNIDFAINREGVDSLSFDDLKNACFTRGLNPGDLAEDELRKFLVDWTELSRNVDESSLSLLLHAPVFLTYNWPTNRRYLIPDVDVKDGG